MKKSVIVFALMSLTSIHIFAQGGGYENDALRYSQNSISGSSRTQSMAGAGVALGADISSANINPAGLGLLRKSEVSISIAIGSASTKTSFLGTSLADSRVFAGLPNFGVVFSKVKDASDPSSFRGGSFAITFSKINNFQNQFIYSGLNSANSVGDFFVEQANGITENTLYNDWSNYEVTSLASAAYNSGIIDPIYRINQNGDTIPKNGTSTSYQTRYPVAQQRQGETVLTKAGQYSWDLSYGGNFNDKFYFGLGLGIQRLNYSYERNFNEYPVTQFPSDLTNINIYDTYSASGYGINLKGGLIYKPIEAIRLGISAQTSTYNSVKEIYNTDFSRITGGKMYSLTFAPGSGNYNLITPSKISPGIAVFFGKHGFITAEASYISYSASHYLNTPTNSDYSSSNAVIKNSFKDTYNLKFGAELRLDKFRLRAGTAYNGDPYVNGHGINRAVTSITAGAGLRLDDHYFDLAIINSRYNSSYSPYTLTNGLNPVATIKNSLTTVNFTYGTYF